MFRRKKNRVVSLEMNDYYIRALIFTDDNLETGVIHEYALQPGIVVDEVVKDEIAFFEVLKTVAKDWNISRHDLRFFVPDHAAMMRAFEHPKELSADELKGYVEMELGRTIHLPFEDPLIDVYDHEEGDGKAVIYASSSEEVMKLVQLYQDVHLNPTVLDVRTLSNLRFFDHIDYFNADETYLIADWSINAVSISIYSNGDVDFLRYQPAEKPDRNWKLTSDLLDNYVFTYDGNIEDYHLPLNEQVFEIERILNFYRFSLHKGEKSVDHIIMLGDNPEMEYIAEQTRAAIDTPVEVIDDVFMRQHYKQFQAKHSALVGLSLKEGSNGA